MENFELLVPEFEYREKSLRWYIYSALATIAFAGIGWLTKNYTFIGLIILSWIIVVMQDRQKPKIVTLAINGSGISLGNKSWEYKELKNYSIYELGSKKYFIFIPKGRFQMEVRIPINDPEPIKTRLNNLLTQVEYEESFLDSLSKIAGI